MKIVIRLSCAAALSAVLAACGSSHSAAASSGSNPYLTDGQAVVGALDAIEAKSGKPLRVTSMTADANGLTVNVQEPGNHVNVDRYQFSPDGTMSGPDPVKLMSMNGGPITAASVDQQVWDPRGAGFARLTQTSQEAIAKSHFPDAHVTAWEIGGLSPDDRRYLYMDAARGRPVAALKPNLTIEEVRF